MPYQVFISFKRGRLDGKGLTRDYEMAADLHKTLLSEGIETFFSEKDLSTSAFIHQIYQALDEAKILIVVGTRREYMESQWVRSEWGKFQSAILNGHKPDGEIITYLDGIREKDVPFALNDMQSFDSKHKADLVNWVKHNLGIKDEPQPAPVPPQPAQPEKPVANVRPVNQEKTAKKPKPVKPEKTSKKPKPVESVKPQSGGKRKLIIGAVAAVLAVAIVTGVVVNRFPDRVAQTNTLKSISDITSIDKVSVGDHYTFGTYEQDGDESNGAEPIEWRVLAIEDNQALLISEYILDSVKYNEYQTDTSWDTCSLKKWLGNHCYYSAFSSEEREKIVSKNVYTVTLRDQYNEMTHTSRYYYETVETVDKIFILSSGEAEQYFSSDIDRVTTATLYVSTQGYVVSSWWLRDNGQASHYIKRVYSSGEIGKEGCVGSQASVGVRPAMWVEI